VGRVRAEAAGKRMQRASVERLRTMRVWRQHRSRHGPGPLGCPCERQGGRLRKGQRIGGCGKARCYLCHGDTLLQRPTLQQRRADRSYREWFYEQPWWCEEESPETVLGTPEQQAIRPFLPSRRGASACEEAEGAGGVVPCGRRLLAVPRLTRHWSRQGKPETLELGDIPCNGLWLPSR
jgi:hypothetical protein